VIALLLLAVAARTDLFHDTVRIPKSQWRAIRVSLRDRPATVDARFDVVEGSSRVRVLLLTDVEVDRFQKGKPFRTIASTDAGSGGSLRHRVARPGEYMVLVDNRTLATSTVALDLRVSLEFESGATFEPRSLPRSTRLAVVALSAGWLLIVGGWSGGRVWRAWRRR
jgi:hypothetical protein